ncbi:MAG: HPr kinase/phosphorylase [Janthinobacterium lividum]
MLRVGDALNLHATTLVVGEAGVLIRGPAGIGKTRLALAIVEDARREGRFAAIVADDRSLVRRHGDRLVARPHPAVTGLVERRGLGVESTEHEPACVLALAVDLVEGWPERMPDPEAQHCMVGGITLPRLAVAREAATPDAVALISADLACRAGLA